MRIKILLSTLFLGLLLACGQSTENGREAGLQAQKSCLGRTDVPIGGPLSLINEDGVRVSESDFVGKPSLIYFGFTYCPDVCPTSLVMIDRALRRLPEGSTMPRTILISVDPERDTPETLKSYIASDPFPDDIVGLTGTEEELRETARTFMTDFARIEQPESEAGYTMDHQSFIYLMDEDWTFRTFFSAETNDSSLAACLIEQFS